MDIEVNTKGGRKMPHRVIRKQAKRRTNEKKIYFSPTELEAFHTELHKLEKENYKENYANDEQKKNLGVKEILEVILLVFIPMVYKNKKSIGGKALYDSVLQIGVGFIMMFLGVAVWGLGVVTVIYIGICGPILGEGRFAGICFGVVIWLLGSLVVMAAIDFSNERNVDKIYRFSSCVIALISCIVSIVAMIVSIAGGIG